MIAPRSDWIMFSRFAEIAICNPAFIV
jgi:hypothetical protein